METGCVAEVKRKTLQEIFKSYFYDCSSGAREGKMYLREYYREKVFVAQNSIVKCYLL